MPATGLVLYMRAWMIGFLLGSLASAFSPWLLPRGAGILLLPLSLLTLCTGWPRRSMLSAALMAVAISSIEGQALLDARLQERCNNRDLSAQGRVASLPRVTQVREGQWRQRFEFIVQSLEPGECAGPRKLLLSYYGREVIEPGQRWRFQLSLRRPWGLSNPGSFNIQSWYAVSGIDALGSVRGSGVLLAVPGAGPVDLHHRLRRLVSRAIDEAGLSAPATAVLKALAVADKSGVDHQLWHLFQAYGISHLLVISGLHVALVAALAFALGRLLRAGLTRVSRAVASWPWAELLALLFAAAYTALAGFSVATVRALIMLSCFLLAQMLGRTSGGYDKLLLSACLLALLNPLVLIGSGFWLSFGAVAGLLWLADWHVSRGRVRNLLLPHLFMAVLMLPLGALWFGGSSWIAAPANLLMIPLVGLVVVPLTLLGAVFSLFGSKLAVLCWQLAALPLDLCWLLSTGLAQRHDLFVPIHGRPLALLLAVMAVALLVLPAGWRLRGSTPVLMLPLLLGSRAPHGAPQLHILDVGQGTAVVFTARDRALLYDTGGGNPAGPNLADSVILPWLHATGIKSLQALVISHDDLDHSAGAGTVVDEIPVERLLVGESLLPGAVPCVAGMAWQWPGKVHFQALSPGGTEKGNDASCVLKIHAPGMRVLLPGDIGVEQERELIRYWRQELKSDVLLVGHHGSLTSTSQSWLNHVAPRVAVIGAGYASRFGHPHPDVMRRLTGQGIVVRETARAGALTISPGVGGAPRISAHRDGYKPWWM